MTPSDYQIAKALRLVAQGQVKVAVRKPPYHSISGAEGAGKAVSWLIRQGMATHDAMTAKARLPVSLTADGTKALAEADMREAA